MPDFFQQFAPLLAWFLYDRFLAPRAERALLRLLDAVDALFQDPDPVLLISSGAQRAEEHLVRDAPQLPLDTPGPDVEHAPASPQWVSYAESPAYLERVSEVAARQAEYAALRGMEDIGFEPRPPQRLRARLSDRDGAEEVLSVQEQEIPFTNAGTVPSEDAPSHSGGLVWAAVFALLFILILRRAATNAPRNQPAGRPAPRPIVVQPVRPRAHRHTSSEALSRPNTSRRSRSHRTRTPASNPSTVNTAQNAPSTSTSAPRRVSGTVETNLETTSRAARTASNSAAAIQNSRVSDSARITSVTFSDNQAAEGIQLTVTPAHTAAEVVRAAGGGTVPEMPDVLARENVAVHVSRPDAEPRSGSVRQRAGSFTELPDWEAGNSTGITEATGVDTPRAGPPSSSSRSGGHRNGNSSAEASGSGDNAKGLTAKGKGKFKVLPQEGARYATKPELDQSSRQQSAQSLPTASNICQDTREAASELLAEPVPRSERVAISSPSSSLPSLSSSSNLPANSAHALASRPTTPIAFSASSIVDPEASYDVFSPRRHSASVRILLSARAEAHEVQLPEQNIMNAGVPDRLPMPLSGTVLEDLPLQPAVARTQLVAPDSAHRAAASGNTENIDPRLLRRSLGREVNSSTQPCPLSTAEVGQEHARYGMHSAEPHPQGSMSPHPFSDVGLSAGVARLPLGPPLDGTWSSRRRSLPGVDRLQPVSSPQDTLTSGDRRRDGSTTANERRLWRLSLPSMRVDRSRSGSNSLAAVSLEDLQEHGVAPTASDEGFWRRSGTYGSGADADGPQEDLWYRQGRAAKDENWRATK